MVTYCDCGDYCEWCHPEMCMPLKGETMFTELLEKLESLRDRLEDFEAVNDTQALVLLELNNVLARAAVILRALAADVTE